MSAERWQVKKEGDEKVYALTNTRADADLLAEKLSRNTSDKYYAKKVSR